MKILFIFLIYVCGFVPDDMFMHHVHAEACRSQKSIWNPLEQVFQSVVRHSVSAPN